MLNYQRVTDLLSPEIEKDENSSFLLVDFRLHLGQSCHDIGQFLQDTQRSLFGWMVLCES